GSEKHGSGTVGPRVAPGAAPLLGQCRGRRPSPPPLGCTIPSAASSPCALVCLVDQPHGPRAVVHADRWRRTSPPMVERIAHCGESRRGDVGAWEGLVALGGGVPRDPTPHCWNGVAAPAPPLTGTAVSPG